MFQILARWTLPNALVCRHSSLCPLRLVLPTLAACLTLAQASQLISAQSQQGERPNPPNILVVMADDMGYSDLGCFGGEIETPNLDALASKGVRFSQFYNTAKCHSSRVSLLTGQYCLAAGDTSLDHAVTTAEVLKESGYFTAMTGKWHLKKEPTDFGFQRYFGHLSGRCNYFRGDGTFRLNGEPWTVPQSGFYTTVANVDHALEFLSEARQEQQPWFLYVAFNAPHEPLHALPEDYEKYRGKYDRGWDEIRAERIRSQQASGLLPKDLQPSPRPDSIPAWDTMEPWRQKYEANRMATLAAMMDRLDQEVGRLVDDIQQHGELERTLIVFVSDNGACPYDRRPPQQNVIPTDADHFYSDSTGWAWARNSPFRYYKQNQFEGGISSPAIMHWPEGIEMPAGSTIAQPVHFIDLLPTIADITSSEIPTSWEGRELRPVSGVSLKRLLQGKELESRPPIHLLFNTDRGLRDGDWKIVSFRGKAWELYNLAEDRTELRNLAKEEPERLRAMVQTWTAMSREQLHAPANQYKEVSPEGPPHHHPEWTRFDRGLQQTQDRGNGQVRRGGIRARKNTRMTLNQGVIDLVFTGEDPGIAMDLRQSEIKDGPYQLRFELTSDAKSGELFYTTSTQQPLPQGKKLEFEIEASSDWQTHHLDIPVTGRLFQIRLDIGNGVGKAKLKKLQLVDATGEILISWPQQ